MYHVTDMNTIFCDYNGAKSFDQDLFEWNVTHVINMETIFNGATSFKQVLLCGVK